jgi:hypothetical protein
MDPEDPLAATLTLGIGDELGWRRKHRIQYLLIDCVRHDDDTDRTGTDATITKDGKECLIVGGRIRLVQCPEPSLFSSVFTLCR